MIRQFPLIIVAVAAGGIWVLILSGNGWGIPHSFFLPLCIVAGALPLLLLAFDRWVWAWPGVDLLTKRPDLRGTWKGVIQSTWPGDERTSAMGVFHAYITISQTFTGLRLRLFTQESQSVTLIALLACEPDEHNVLSALYRNVPRQLARSHNSIHHGGLLLKIGGEQCDRLTGSYWTDRETTGELQFRRVSRRRFRDYETADEALSSLVQ
jgi:hypothetical protein